MFFRLFLCRSRRLRTLSSTAPVGQNSCLALGAVDRRECSAKPGISSGMASFCVRNGVQTSEFPPEHSPETGILSGKESRVLGKECEVRNSIRNGVQREGIQSQRAGIKSQASQIPQMPGTSFCISYLNILYIIYYIFYILYFIYYI